MPKTFALLINQIDGSYQRNFWQAASNRICEGDDQLLILAGGPLDSPVGTEASGNSLYGIVPRLRPDGLVLLSGALSAFTDHDQWQAFLHSLGNIPRVSVSDDPAEGVILKIDNRRGLENLLTHLADSHHLSRLAFVSGPDRNPEAVERLAVFKSFCATRGWTIPDNWLIEGNFRPESGLAAIKKILDSPGEKPQGVVFSNDDMLFGALDEIRRRAVRIPEDLVLTGFDDIDEMGRLTPGVTTVRQPLALLGRTAIDLLETLTAGERVPPVTVMATETVIRQTCGCPAGELHPDGFFVIPRDYMLETFIRYLRSFTSRGQGAETRKEMYQALQDMSRNLSLTPFSVYLFLKPGNDLQDSDLLYPEFRHIRNDTGDCHKPVSPRGGIAWNHLPEDLSRQGRIHVILPLNNRHEYYGIIVFHDPAPDDDPLVFDSLGEAVGGVLHARFLFEKLQDRERHFRELAFRLPAALAETGKEGGLKYLNEAACKLFGTDRDRSGSFDNLFPVAEQERFRELAERIRTLGDDQFATFDIAGEPWLFKGEIDEPGDASPDSAIRWLGISLKPFLETLDLPVERFYGEYHLSKRERQILELVIHGCRSKEIAERLNLALSTVKNYISGIYSALDINTREELFDMIRDYQISRLGQEKYLHSVLGALLKSGGS